MPLTPTPGAAAQAAGFTLVPGTGLASDIEEYINRALDEVAAKLQSVWSIAAGGTGANTKGGARDNLDVPHDDSGSVIRFFVPSFGRLSFEIPGYAYSTGLALDVDVAGANAAASAAQGTANSAQSSANNANSNADGRVSKGGDTMSGQLYLPNSSAATSGFTVCYINSDGRVSRGSSSQRYKKYISPFEPQGLGDIWPAFQRYKMRGDGVAPAETTWRYGYIAEEIAQHPDQERFTVYREIDGDVVPDSIDFIGLLIAQTAQLHQRDQDRQAELDLAADRIRQLEDRLTALEERA